MLTIEAALERILAAVRRGEREVVGLSEAYGRVLAEDLAAPGDQPAWDNSAMDGYAVRAAETPGTLTVTDTIAAGQVGRTPVTSGNCSRIYTGAPLPEGADAVVMQEDTEPAGDRVIVRRGATPGLHVRRRGADVVAGTVVLQAGRVLTPAAVGMVASLGIASVRVAVRPVVAILSTGDEVVPPGTPLSPGQIHSSNNHALAGLVIEAGAVPLDLGNVPDDPARIAEAFTHAARVADLVVSTGGVSVGDFDHVKGVLGDAVDFWRVAMKPGKPLAFGAVGGKPFFGLPGNPVSCMVNFLQFVRPAIRTRMGDPRPFLPVLTATLSRPIRRQTGRVELVRVALSRDDRGLVATPAGGHQGSGNVRSMADAHGFALLDADSPVVEGEVPVQVFDPSYAAGEAPEYRWAARAHPESGGDDCC